MLALFPAFELNRTQDLPFKLSAKLVGRPGIETRRGGLRSLPVERLP